MKTYSSWVIVICLLLVHLSIQAQYRRRGETLQTPNGKSKSAGKKTNFTLAALHGRWQELTRTERNGLSPVGFNDSIQLYFLDSNKVLARNSSLTSMALRGEADIDDDNTLTVAADQYTIKSLNDKELVLDDNENYLHRLVKVDSFWYEKQGRVAMKKTDYSTPIQASLAKILGNWSVYRRQANPGAVSGKELLLENLQITSKTSETTATGQVGFYQGKNSQQLPCKIQLSGTSIKVTAGTNTWDFSIFQADGDNLVFGNNILRYFCKKEQ